MCNIFGTTAKLWLCESEYAAQQNMHATSQVGKFV